MQPPICIFFANSHLCIIGTNYKPSKVTFLNTHGSAWVGTSRYALPLMVQFPTRTTTKPPKVTFTDAENQVEIYEKKLKFVR